MHSVGESSSTSSPQVVLSSRRNSRRATLEEDEQEVAGIEIDRVSFMNTALRALPGNTLRTFFAPVMNVKSVFFRRRRLTQTHMSSDPAKMERIFKETIRVLTKALVDASIELFENPMPLDEKDLATALAGKMTPVCYEPGAVLVYPGEYPETMFVHVVLSGSVQVVSYQPQSRKGGIGDSSKRQYFVSNDTLRLNGSLGFQPDLFKYVTNSAEAASDSASDIASTSNVSTAIQRSLRRASRLIGQPTLLPTRTELFRAPYVCCATEALGLEPFRLATITAEATAPSAKGDVTTNTRVTETMRIRAKDLHDALIEVAISKNKKSKGGSSAAGTSRHILTLVEYIAAARVRSVSRHYPLNEILMRQSWLLQDTPAHTIRALVTQLTPHSYFPGEVILCPHTQSRQLCFLRRGTMTIEEPPVMDNYDDGCCRCSNFNEKRKILQEVPVGASFGELSVLFGEPRHFVLRAQTACDVWCLSHHSFAATVRRDDALRESLLSKAAALRMRWLGEQRFTASLAQKLRECCELFREAADSFIYLVQERIEPVVCPPGTLLTSTSSRCTEMYIILHGRVTSIVDGVAEYGPGSVIGESTIISHRWPLGLVSKSMVEGWKLDRKKLLDALYRIEILRRHSGEVGAHAPQLMQHVFAPPVPPCDVDAVGRSRMPLVGPPPSGRTYLEYAQWLAELQLKALCFRYRDYVKWSDISYTTLPGERGRQFVMEQPVASMMEFNPINGNETTDTVVGSAVNAARKGKKPKSAQKQAKRKVVAGSVFPFYVNGNMTQQPFTRPNLRKPPVALLDDDDDDKSLSRQRALTTGWKSQTNISLLPQLKQLTILLENRDKMQKVEAKQNVLNDTEQERMELIGMSHDVTVTSGPPPVHIFLQGSSPRVQITVAEAIAVGYVLQFPDTKRIQSCVSNIDPDVTIGLPQHRERRSDMALTPNERHYRHRFLFAASKLGENTAEEAMVREAATREAESKGKAEQLTVLLLEQISDKRRHSNEIGTMTSDAGLQTSTDWNKISFVKSLSRDGVSPGNQSTPGNPCTPRKQRSSPASVANAEHAFLQQLTENPNRAIDSLRAKFAVPQDSGFAPNFASAEEGAEGSFCHSSSGGTAAHSVQGEGVMERLRCVPMILADSAGGEGSPTGPPPRGPGTYADDKGASKTTEEGESVMEKFMRRDDAPLFIDGYGQLGMEAKTPFTEGNASKTEEELPTPGETFQRSGSNIPPEGEGERSQASHWVPHNFVMPTVNEATATMRRIQRDVNGLNAVAEEQRREKLQKHRQRVEHTPETFEGPIPQELQRVVEDWTSTYRANARDPLCPATIPPQLLPEAGTDYLAEEFHNTRRRQQQQQQQQQGGEGNYEPCGVEMWRGDVELKDRRDGGRFREAARSCPSRNLLTDVGSKKFGLPSKPLRNPTYSMSKEEYEQWVAERDATFAAASRQK
ncbi:Cyclic nucleotide-binding domain [Trypanosoma melophagium]|uniref:Cyclic nucleotide-binding domain n=1 Tax=Trypanosoma melophagium TaxID=715481 RepID=UPI00351AABAB|nr:Cyclic nucleotide-binding domain [Trypanosoma melophagium]